MNVLDRQRRQAALSVTTASSPEVLVELVYFASINLLKGHLAELRYDMELDEFAIPLTRVRRCLGWGDGLQPMSGIICHGDR